MENFENKKDTYKKIGNHRGIEIYVGGNVPREWVAEFPPPRGAILIHPDAYEILKKRPDFLERIYEHEIEAGSPHDPHECLDSDILVYLKNNGYDFGDFNFEEKK